MSKKKIVFSTIFIVLFIQGLIAGGLILIFYYNYEKFSTSSSGVSTKVNANVEIKDLSKILTIEKKEVKTNQSDILYEGNLGYVRFMHNVDVKEGETIEEKKYIYNINGEGLKKIIILNILKENKILDKYIATYFLKLDDKIDGEIEKEFISYLNFAILINYDIKIEAILKDFENKYLENISIINEELNKGDTELLSKLLYEIEEKYISLIGNIPVDISLNNKILQNDKFQYVIKKLYGNDYYSNISKVSEIFGINEKMLVSTIGIEQLRFLLSERGYAKGLIKQNKYLTNFSKFSYGLGGVKIPTSRKIQSGVKENDIKLYNKYFKKDFGQSDSYLIKKIETHFGGILYSGALIYIIENRWDKAGFSLKYKPGVISTLYNMGNPVDKKPHNIPDMGGSILYVDNNKLYFGELGHIMYYYLSYYYKSGFSEKEMKEKVIFIKRIKEEIIIDKDSSNNTGSQDRISEKDKKSELIKQKIIEKNKEKELKVTK